MTKDSTTFLIQTNFPFCALELNNSVDADVVALILVFEGLTVRKQCFGMLTASKLNGLGTTAVE